MMKLRGLVQLGYCQENLNLHQGSIREMSGKFGQSLMYEPWVRSCKG